MRLTEQTTYNTAQSWGKRRRISLQKFATIGAIAALTCGISFSPEMSFSAAQAQEVSAGKSAQNPFVVGVGIGDITGEPGEVGFMGYGDSKQQGSGVQTRQYARAFEVQDPATHQRNLVIVLDQLSAFENTREELVKNIIAEFGDAYSEDNIMITATHTHATPGGLTRYGLYNVTTMGMHPDTVKATVDGTLDAVRKAQKNLAPGNVTVSHSELEDVGVNRSAEALKKDPEELTRELKNGVDPTNISFKIEQSGKTVGIINWFALHPTSLLTTNTLISTDNKGYASWLLEHEDHGVDHYSKSGDGFVAAFANSNTGDVTPNTQLKPGMGPTDDPFKNMKILGTKVADEARSHLKEAGNPVGSGLDSRIHYADFSKMTVNSAFTGTGKEERTCEASLGQSFGSGSVEDGGGGLSVFGEGVGYNPFFSAMSRIAYNISPDLKACQAPKDNLLAVGAVDAVQEKLPVQIMRFGDYYILGMPGELTGAVGVQYRQDAAKLFGVPESHIVIQGYTNAYSHYVTTPEEYDSQEYEGGSTVFGRYTAPAFRQVLNQVGTSLKNGSEIGLGDKPREMSALNSTQGKVLYDLPITGKSYGEETVKPQAEVARGETVSAEFVGAHPNNNLRHNDSYLVVERFNGTSWEYVTSDNDPETSFNWKRELAAQSRVTLKWNVPQTAPSGEYRFVYHGDAKDSLGTITPIQGTSTAFTIK